MVRGGRARVRAQAARRRDQETRVETFRDAESRRRRRARRRDAFARAFVRRATGRSQASTRHRGGVPHRGQSAPRGARARARARRRRRRDGDSRRSRRVSLAGRKRTLRDVWTKRKRRLGSASRRVGDSRRAPRARRRETRGARARPHPTPGRNSRRVRDGEQTGGLAGGKKREKRVWDVRGRRRFGRRVVARGVRAEGGGVREAARGRTTRGRRVAFEDKGARARARARATRFRFR